MARGAALLVLAAACLVGDAGASIYLGSDAARPKLAIDAKGNAQVTWLAGGSPQSLIVPPRGQLYHGGSLSGPDVSRPAKVAGLPGAIVVRRTKDGRLWALQAWQYGPGAPVDLNLSRWDGAPTKLTLAFDGTRLRGRLEYHGKPVSGFTKTLEGKRLRLYVYLDCFRCGIAKTGWGRMIGVPPKADGTFQVLVRPEWQGARFRASALGPNLGSTYAPDASAIVSRG